MDFLQNYYVLIYLFVTLCELSVQTKTPILSPIITPLTGQPYPENMRKFFVMSPTSSSERTPDSTRTVKSLSPLSSDDGLMFEMSLDSKSAILHRTDSLDSTGASKMMRIDSLTNLDDFIQKALLDEKSSLENHGEFPLRRYSNKNSPEIIPHKNFHQRNYSLENLNELLKKNPTHQRIPSGNNTNEIFIKAHQQRPERFVIKSHHRKYSLDNLLDLKETKDMVNSAQNPSIKEKKKFNKKILLTFGNSKDFITDTKSTKISTGNDIKEIKKPNNKGIISTNPHPVNKPQNLQSRPPNPHVNNYLRNIRSIKPVDSANSMSSPFHVPSIPSNLYKQENNMIFPKFKEALNDNLQELTRDTEPEKVDKPSSLREARVLTSTTNQQKENLFPKTDDPNNSSTLAKATNETIYVSKKKNVQNQREKTGSVNSLSSKIKEGSPDSESSKSIKRGISPKEVPVLDTGSTFTSPQESKLSRDPSSKILDSSNIPSKTEFSPKTSSHQSKISSNIKFPLKTSKETSSANKELLETSMKTSSTNNILSETSAMNKKLSETSMETSSTNNILSETSSMNKKLSETSMETSSTNKKLSEISSNITQICPNVTCDTILPEKKSDTIIKSSPKSSHESRTPRDSSPKISTSNKVKSEMGFPEALTDSISLKTTLSRTSKTSSPKIISKISPENKLTNTSLLNITSSQESKSDTIIKSSPKSSHESRTPRDSSTKISTSNKVKSEMGFPEALTDSISLKTTLSRASKTSSPKIISKISPENKLTNTSLLNITSSQESKISSDSSTKASRSSIKITSKMGLAEASTDTSSKTTLSRSQSKTTLSRSQSLTSKMGFPESSTDTISSKTTLSGTSQISSPKIIYDTISPKNKLANKILSNIMSPPNLSHESKPSNTSYTKILLNEPTVVSNPSNINTTIPGTSNLKKPINKSPINTTEDVLAFNLEGKKKKKRVPRTDKPDENSSRDRLKIRQGSKSTSALPSQKRIRHPTIVSIKQI